MDRQVESARATFQRAEIDYDRSQEMFRAGDHAEIGRRPEARELRAREGRAQQGPAGPRPHAQGPPREAGQTGLESIIRAPAAGTILTRLVNPGDPVVPLTSYQPGTELATIADMSDLIFKGTVDEIDVGKLHVDLPARIKVGALPTDVVTGRVSRIAPQAQQKEGATLFDVEIELDRARRSPSAPATPRTRTSSSARRRTSSRSPSVWSCSRTAARRASSRSRTRRRRAAGRAEEDRDQDRHLRRPERRGRERPRRRATRSSSGRRRRSPRERKRRLPRKGEQDELALFLSKKFAGRDATSRWLHSQRSSASSSATCAARSCARS